MNSEGIGLGLTIVRQIVHEAGGSIKVKSKGLGFGSKFCFTMLLPPVEQNDSIPLIEPKDSIRNLASIDFSLNEVWDSKDSVLMEMELDFIKPIKTG